MLSLGNTTMTQVVFLAVFHEKRGLHILDKRREKDFFFQQQII
jgi:hypothetical protein